MAVDTTFPLPGTGAYVSRMKEVAHAIEHAAGRDAWVEVELLAAELAKLCEIRRAR